MTVEQLLAQGNLAAAVEALKAEVRRDPAQPRPRIGLVQALCLTGDWERAANQARVLGGMKADHAMLQTVLTSLIQCEIARAGVFAGRHTPLIFGEPSDWVGGLVQANQMQATGDRAGAASLRQAALAAAPAVAGTANGQRFAWIADGDCRLGPLFEAMLNGRYYWLPPQAVAAIDLAAPQHLRDVVWQPVIFTLTNGGQVQGFMPVRYPGSERATDDLLCLARRTDWQPLSETDYLGLGQRMWYTEGGEWPQLETRTIVLDHAHE